MSINSRIRLYKYRQPNQDRIYVYTDMKETGKQEGNENGEVSDKGGGAVRLLGASRKGGRWFRVKGVGMGFTEDG